MSYGYGSVDKKLVASEPISIGSSHSCGSFLTIVFIGVAALGFVLGNAWTVSPFYSANGGVTLTSTLVIEDSYSRLGYPPLGSAYLNYNALFASSSIVEPYREVKLKLTVADCSQRPVVFIVGGVEFISDTECVAKNVTFNVLGRQVVVVVSASSGAVQWKGLVFVKYARREVRKLSEADRSRFLDAMQVLWNVPTREGRRLYGERYIGHDNLTVIHANRAADLYCDHLHDGTGFLMQHAAFSLVIERSLQSVDRSVALPYWGKYDLHLADQHYSPWLMSYLRARPLR